MNNDEKMEWIDGLALAAQAGDESVYSELFEALIPFLQGYVKGMNVQIGDIHLELWKAIQAAVEKYDPTQSHFSYFVRKPAYWAACEYLRSESRHPDMCELDEEVFDFFDQHGESNRKKDLSLVRKMMYAFASELVEEWPEFLTWRERHLSDPPMTYDEMAEEHGRTKQYWHSVDAGSNKKGSLAGRFGKFLKAKGVYDEFQNI